MQNIFVTDNDVQLVLVPDNELDRLLLTKLLDNGPVEIIRVSQPIGVIGQSIKDGIIIKRKISSDDPSKA
jgi:hypothetical protein